MILNLTPLEDAWGAQPEKNIYKSNEPQRKFLSSGMNLSNEKTNRVQDPLSNQYQNQNQLSNQYQNQLSNQYQNQFQTNSAVTKNDIYQSGLFHQRRVDVALYNDIVIEKLGHMTGDEKTFYVTNALIEYNKPQQKNSKTIEYFNSPRCDEYHKFDDSNNGIDVLWIITLFLIILLIDKIYMIWKNS